MSQQELKVCPLCGENALVEDTVSVDVGVGTMQGPEVWHCEACQSYWNGPYSFKHQRSPSPDQEAARLREAAKRLGRASRRVIIAFILCRKEWPEEKRLTAPEFDARLQEWEDAQASLAALAPPSQEG